MEKRKRMKGLSQMERATENLRAMMDESEEEEMVESKSTLTTEQKQEQRDKTGRAFKDQQMFVRLCVAAAQAGEASEDVARRIRGKKIQRGKYKGKTYAITADSVRRRLKGLREKMEDAGIEARIPLLQDERLTTAALGALVEGLLAED